MKYLVRAIKYFFYFAVIVALMVGALVLVGAVDGNIDTMFRGGWNAIWKMAILFAAVASVYPKLGLVRDENGYRRAGGSAGEHAAYDFEVILFPSRRVYRR